MTADELRAARVRLNEVDTRRADCRRAIDEGISAARQINAHVRATQTELRPLDQEAEALRAAIKTHEAEEAARLRAEAEAKAKEAAEAKRKAQEAKKE